MKATAQEKVPEAKKEEGGGDGEQPAAEGNNEGEPKVEEVQQVMEDQVADPDAPPVEN